MSLTHQLIENSNSKVCDIKVPVLMDFLKGYCVHRCRFLYLGLTYGFKLHYHGPKISNFSKNHKSALLKPDEVLKKLQKEKAKKHIEGPFDSPPFDPFIVSPIGLVPKKETGKFRMIHDLSYPKNQGTSVNAFIPRSYCSVRYEDFDVIADLVVKNGMGCFIGKIDIESAFRIIPIHPSDYWLLGIEFHNKFYYDKRLPMGASISCSTFEEVSKSIQWIMINVLKTSTDWSHILDDFMAVDRNKENCEIALRLLLRLCEQLCIPINHDKTVWPSTEVEVHGIEIDTVAMVARLPEKKLDKARDLVQKLSFSRRVQLKDIQEALGFLNFACRVVRPGRTFLRRLYDLCRHAYLPSHNVRITKEARKDLKAWSLFLSSYNGVSILCKKKWLSSSHMLLQSDAADTGFAAILNNEWFMGGFSAEEKSLHITVRELYPIAISLGVWSANFQNKCVLFMCDNEAVVHIINKQTSKDPKVMSVLRFFIIQCMKYNILFRAKHVPGQKNVLADALSRQQVTKAREIRQTLKSEPTSVPLAWTLSRIQHDF